MSDLSDSDTNEPNNNNESEDIHVNDTEDHVVERIFDLSNRLQAYCRIEDSPSLMIIKQLLFYLKCIIK